MKTKSLVVLFVCLTAIVGVSCNSEAMVSKCNLETKGIELEISGVTYQYSVEKLNSDSGDKIIDWTEFDVNDGFSVTNLLKGKYKFSVRGINNKGALMYAGNKTVFLTQNGQKDISIVLYPQFDETTESTLKINLLSTALDNSTARCYIKSCGAGTLDTPEEIVLSKSDTGFTSASIPLLPGYYEINSFVYQNGVEVGGTLDIVLVPSGYEKRLDVHISPRSFEGFVDIEQNSTLKVKKDDVVTLGWTGNCMDANGNGFWFVGNKIVEDNALYYTIPTDKEGSFVVEYWRGSSKTSCTVTVESSQQTINVYIMNFRCASFSNNTPCIGYKDKTTGKMFTESKTTVPFSETIKATDYTTLNLEPVYGTLEKATFAEVGAESWVLLKYGQSTTIQNTTLKKLIIRGSLSANKISDKFVGLEEVVLDGPTTIAMNAFKNLTNLKTVHIIPPADGKTTISTKAFASSGVEKVIVYGSESQISLLSSWISGNDMTKDDIVYNAKLPL